jgi:multidrug efflux pump subunit AcrA (membrane-fusion protein)
VLTIADIGKLRIGTYVEQRDVPFVHVGDSVEVADAANPERAVRAAVSRSGGQLDARSRTLYVEVDVDNAEGFLVPGSFVYLTLHVPIKSLPQVPASALMMRGDDAFVAKVDEAGTIHFARVKVQDTDGRVVRLADGVALGERVAINLPGDVTDGGRIQPIRVATKAP